MKLTVIFEVHSGDKLIVDRTEVETDRSTATINVAHELGVKLAQWDKDQKAFQDSQG